MRPVSRDVGVNGGRELREFVDEHGDEALEMRLFVRFDTAGFTEVRIPLEGILGTRSAGPEEDGENMSTAVSDCIVEGRGLGQPAGDRRNKVHPTILVKSFCAQVRSVTPHRPRSAIERILHGRILEHSANASLLPREGPSCRGSA